MKSCGSAPIRRLDVQREANSLGIFKTRNGPVKGHRAAPDVVSVLGIPYAAAPFGANRFREPRPSPAWTGVRNCTDFGAIAPQSAQLPGAPAWSPDDEDILTVNIWSPAPKGGCLPVLVWIHGGAYTFGSSAQPDFDGTTLARAGLVVVTLNYRLGFEGFGHIPDSEGTSYPDNRGLLDQVAALHWVRENIAAFGGDPGNVTVAGQSSGAASIACLMVMDRARGLFRRAITHSAASPGDPGWLPVNDSITHARVWNSDDDPAVDNPTGIRALWAEAEFPVLRP